MHLAPAKLKACAWLGQAITRLQLSARPMHRIFRAPGTVANLGGCEGIGTAHLGVCWLSAIGSREAESVAIPAAKN